jgi:hypothetical protein
MQIFGSRYYPNGLALRETKVLLSVQMETILRHDPQTEAWCRSGFPCNSRNSLIARRESAYGMVRGGKFHRACAFERPGLGNH